MTTDGKKDDEDAAAIAKGWRLWRLRFVCGVLVFCGALVFYLGKLAGFLESCLEKIAVVIFYDD